MARPADAVPETRGFPRAFTSFLGRAGDVDRLTRLLSGHRLVTVTGPGGVGKTRLAAEVTRHLPDQFGDRIWLVELAAVSEAGQVPAAAAARLCAPPRAGRSMTQSVADVLAGEPSLLVLDNCEHVVAAVAESCSELLSRTDDVVILATSREPIGVAGEARMRLRPLATGEPDIPWTGEAGGVAFVRRPGAPARSGLRLTAGSAALVQERLARLRPGSV